VNRFGFSLHAEFDIDELTRYLQGLPLIPASRIGREIQQAIATIASAPLRAPVDEELSHLANYKIHRLVCGDYLLFYHSGEPFPMILGVLHGKRDTDTIMRQRLGED
jgi:plasmid stabilization system protein ParE